MSKNGRQNSKKEYALTLECAREIKEHNNQVVSAKELYDFLCYNHSQWSRWYKMNIIYDDLFEEGIDYVGCKQFNTLDMVSNGNFTKDLDFTSFLTESPKDRPSIKYE